MRAKTKTRTKTVQRKPRTIRKAKTVSRKPRKLVTRKPRRIASRKPRVNPVTEAIRPFCATLRQNNKPLTVSHRAYMRQLRKIQKRELRKAFYNVPFPQSQNMHYDRALFAQTASS